MQRFLIPTGRWNVQAESAHEQLSLRLTGRAFSDPLKLDQHVHTIVLTQDQTQELISTLNAALRELELQRKAALARAADGEGGAQTQGYSLFRG